MSAPMVKTDTPGVYARGSRFVVVFYDHEGKQRKRSAPTYKRAVKLKAQLTADVERGEYSELSRVRFIDYAREWVERYQGRRGRGIRENTRSDYRKALERHAIPYFGRRRLSDIRPVDISRFAAEVAKTGVSPGTVRLQLAPVKCLFSSAVKEGLIRSNPAREINYDLPRPQTDEADEEEHVKALDEDELRRFLAELPETWRFFFTFLVHTGLRIGEAIALQWKHVDLASGYLLVRRRYYRGGFDAPKSKYGRRDIRLSPGLLQELGRRWLVAGEDPEALVFPSQTGGVLDQSNLMARVLKPAAVRAGLGEWVVSRGEKSARSWVGFHSMRHTCASILFKRGWNPKQVQMLLGHHSPGFTQEVYVHLLPSDLPEPSFLDEITGPVAMSGGNETPGNDRNSADEGTDETADSAGALLLRLPAASAS